ncbi:MAG: S8/S53 family peptidase [Sedimentisphaerales bacterium]|nr:S8/S53 family peptidase [Sedimentisphaerales bacterium]
MKKYLFICTLIVLYFINTACASEDSLKFPKIDRKPKPAYQGRGKIKNIPRFDPNSDNTFQVDLRGCDLSQIDLHNLKEDLTHADFDDKTVWPALEKMPPGFDYRKIMEIGKNPGLGLREIHKQGITGKNIGIAIIDNPLLVDHQEYADRVRLYEEINVMEMKEAEDGRGDRAHMHGTAVVSIAAGKTLGVAPGADIYYIGAWPFVFHDGKVITDFKARAVAVNRILEINSRLPENRKIRVISMSIGWDASQSGYKEISQAAEKAKQAGMLFICSSTEEIHGFRFHGLGRKLFANPDDFNSYEPGLWWAKKFYENYSSGYFVNRLLVPMDSRTTAGPTGVNDYVFYSQGGWSWSIPYIAGMYALCCQADPDITPGRFWALALKTGLTIDLQRDDKNIKFGRILSPAALITAVKTGEPVDETVVKPQMEKFGRSDKSTPSIPVFQKDFISKIAQLDMNRGSYEDVITIFGAPLYYSTDTGTADGNNLPLKYAMFYSDDFIVGIMDNRIRFVKMKRQGYLFEGKIGVGSSYDDVMGFFGPPGRIVKNESKSKISETDVLYQDVDGVKGRFFYQSKKYRVAVWMMNDTVIEMTILGSVVLSENK